MSEEHKMTKQDKLVLNYLDPYLLIIYITKCAAKIICIGKNINRISEQNFILYELRYPDNFKH